MLHGASGIPDEDVKRGNRTWNLQGEFCNRAERRVLQRRKGVFKGGIRIPMIQRNMGQPAEAVKKLVLHKLEVLNCQGREG